MTHFAIFHTYNTYFKAEALHLVSDEGLVKCLLLLYKWLIQPYLSLIFWLLATSDAFLTRVMPIIDDIDSKSHKTGLKSSTIIQPIKITPLVIYGLRGHTHTHTHTHVHTFADENDYKKSVVYQPGAGAPSLKSC